MERTVATVLVMATIGFASQGCGDVDDQAETTQSALGGFGTWQFASQSTYGSFLNSPSAPALARGTGGASLVAFGRDTGPRTDGFPGGGIFVTSKSASSGNWSFFWRNLDFQFPFDRGFTSGPSAVLFDISLGSLAAHYAIVAKRDDNKFYFTIRNGTGGGIVQQWTPLPGGLFAKPFSAPSVTYIPNNSTIGPQRTIVVAGLGDDGVVYWATNKLASDLTYHNEAWTGFHGLPGGNPPNQTFVGSPSITFACQTLDILNGPPRSSLVLAIMAEDPNGTRTFFSRRFTGTFWTGWSQAQNGTFHDGPALAAPPSCGSRPEISLFGLGGDDQIWVTTQLSGGPAGFTPLPVAPVSALVGQPPPVDPPHFAGAPSAVGTSGVANVAALTFVGEMASNKATSP
jgi:hypothetical protein